MLEYLSPVVTSRKRKLCAPFVTSRLTVSAGLQEGCSHDGNLTAMFQEPGTHPSTLVQEFLSLEVILGKHLELRTVIYVQGVLIRVLFNKSQKIESVRSA